MSGTTIEKRAEIAPSPEGAPCGYIQPKGLKELWFHTGTDAWAKVYRRHRELAINARGLALWRPGTFYA